jgi:hypothetical protein
MEKIAKLTLNESKTRTIVQQMLLVCGILSSVLWIGADILASLLLEGYSYFHQAPSELSAIGASTKSLLTPTGFAYSVFLTAFGFGVWFSAHQKRSMRISAGLLIAYGIISFAWFFVPMHPRGTEFTITDILHVVMAAVTVLMVLFIIGFGSGAFGKSFRIYSIVTILLLVVFGGLTFLQADRVAADLPTPWMGVYERINVYGYMLWIVVFSAGLLHRQEPITDPWSAAQ